MTRTLRHRKGFGSEEAKVEPGLLRRVERMLVSEHEAAMDDFSRCRWNLSPRKESNAACERSIAAMRRLGAFLKTGKIPPDLHFNYGKLVYASNSARLHT